MRGEAGTQGPAGAAVDRAGDEWLVRLANRGRIGRDPERTVAAADTEGWDMAPRI